MSGFELLSHIKKDSHWKDTHIIIISGSRADGQEAIQAGANQFLLKPFTLNHLEKALSNL